MQPMNLHHPLLTGHGMIRTIESLLGPMEIVGAVLFSFGALLFLIAYFYKVGLVVIETNRRKIAFRCDNLDLALGALAIAALCWFDFFTMPIS
ncbi:hypothetical protein ACWF50_11050 [Brucella pseudogrignonensis]